MSKHSTFFLYGLPLLFALITLALPGGARATPVVITFESFPGPDGKLDTADDVPIVAPYAVDESSPQVTDQYLSLGVEFLLYPYYYTNLLVDRTYNAPQGTPSDNALISVYPYFETPAYITGRFSVPVRTFSVEVLHQSYRHVTIYGASGVLSQLSGVAGVRDFTSLEDIVSFQVWGDYEADHRPTAIDNVAFTVVPEPATTLAAAGAGLALSGRRLRRS